jgi:transposase
VRIGLESGQLSTWLFHELKARRLPVICIYARHAKATLSAQINKTDANDAHGIAQIVRVGWYREVAVESMDSHAIRAVLVARAQLVTHKVSSRTASESCSRLSASPWAGERVDALRQWCGSYNWLHPRPVVPEHRVRHDD